MVLLKVMEFKSSEVLILMMLTGGERYANEMVKLFSRRRMQTYRSTVHYALRRLVRQGLVATRRQISSKNGGRKEKLCFYHLTGRGHIELQRCLELFDSFRTRTSRSIPGEPLKRISGL